MKTARSALADGVVPGGGAALLASVPALSNLVTADLDESFGVLALAHALAVPVAAMRLIFVVLLDGEAGVGSCRARALTEVR